MLKKHKKGQSTLEYMILVVAVIVVIIYLLIGSSSPFRNAFNTTLMGSVNKMNFVGNRLNTIGE